MVLQEGLRKKYMKIRSLVGDDVIQNHKSDKARKINPKEKHGLYNKQNNYLIDLKGNCTFDFSKNHLIHPKDK